MANEEELNRRIRDRAYQIWLDEGMPEGRAEDHWELARLAIAHEDGQEATLVPVEKPLPEPAAVMDNLGEFPTLTDQGEEQTHPKVR